MNTKKILYVAPGLNLEKTRFLGVKKKVLGQIKGFEKNGFEVVFVDTPCQHDETDLKGDPGYIESIKFRLRNAVRSFLPLFCIDLLSCFREAIGNNSRVVVYVRKPLMNYYNLWLLYRISKLPNVTCSLLEIPTWPYDNELKAYPEVLRREKVFRSALKLFINKIVTFSDEKKILGIETIKIDNGINIDDVKCVEKVASENDEIRFLGVAHLSEWTGYDRFIRGLSDYLSVNREKKLKFLIAGVGNEMESLKELVVALELDEVVEFCGNQDGGKLDALFDQADVCIGNLAWHRVGIAANSDLKNREYCARGIPFVTSTIDPGFPSDFPPVFRIAADETPVDVEAVVGFYDELQRNHSEYAEQMHAYAAEHFDWSMVLKPIVKDISSLCD